MEAMLFGIALIILAIILLVVMVIAGFSSHLAPFKKMNRKEKEECYLIENQIKKTPKTTRSRGNKN